jgi:hypothetical protein
VYKHKRDNRGHDNYDIHVFPSCLGNPVKKGQGTKTMKDDKFIYVPLDKIEKCIYNGPVFDIEVEDVESFITISGIVHNCRLYGLWPKEVYDKRAETVANALNMPKEQVPLNTQCEFVKRKNKEPLTIEQINDMYNTLDKLDLHLLIQNDLTLKEDIEHKIGARWNYRTIHDWLLFLFFGEEWLASLTNFSLAAKKEALEDFINILEKTVVPQLLDKKII